MKSNVQISQNRSFVKLVLTILRHEKLFNIHGVPERTDYQRQPYPLINVIRFSIFFWHLPKLSIRKSILHGSKVFLRNGKLTYVA